MPWITTYNLITDLVLALPDGRFHYFLPCYNMLNNPAQYTPNCEYKEFKHKMSYLHASISLASSLLSTYRTLCQHIHAYFFLYFAVLIVTGICVEIDPAPHH